MTEFLAPQLSGDGYDKCAHPYQVPSIHLMDDYLALKTQIQRESATNPNTRVQSEPYQSVSAFGTSESLIVDGKVRMTRGDITHTGHPKSEPDLIYTEITDKSTNTREVSFAGSNRKEISFTQKDEAGNDVSIGALLHDSHVVSETIEGRLGHAVAEFEPTGMMKSAFCSNTDHHLTYSKNSLFDSIYAENQQRESLDRAVKWVKDLF